MADHVYQELVRRFGGEAVFKDVDKLHPGHKFKSKLDEIIAECDIALVIIGEKWAGAEDEGGRSRLHDQGDYVRKEVEAVLRRDIPIIPLVIEGASVPKAKNLPDELQELVEWQAVSIHYDPYFHKDMEYLADNLKELIGKERENESGSLRRLFQLWPAASRTKIRESVPPPHEIEENRERDWYNASGGEKMAGSRPGWYVYLFSVLAGMLLTYAVLFPGSVFFGLSWETDWYASKALPAALTGSGIVIVQGFLGWLFGVLWPKPGWRWGLWLSIAPLLIFFPQIVSVFLDVQRLLPIPRSVTTIMTLILAGALILMPAAACLGARHGARLAVRRAHGQARGMTS